MIGLNISIANQTANRMAVRSSQYLTLNGIALSLDGANLTLD